MTLETTETGLARPRSFAALREIARSLSAAWDLDTTLDLIARKTTEVMGVDSCTIYLLDPDDVTLRLRATTGLARQSLGRATLQIGEGMTGYAVAQNRPIYAADAQHDPHFKWVDDTGERRFRSLLAMPLVLNDRPIGALNVQTTEPRGFSDEEIDILALLSDLAAGALVKARLYDRQRRQLDELRALAQVSAAITSPQYLDDILEVVTELAAQTVGATACAIHLLESNGHDAAAEPAAFAGRLAGHTGAALPDAAALARVAESGRPFHAPQPDGGSLLAVPLAVQERVIGVLTCLAPPGHPFGDGQEVLLTTLANQTALAIENARLVTNVAVVREMHHRIKNNLQTVAMLMQLQLPEADRLETRQVLLTNIHRIRSIAAVHEVLSDQGFRLVDVKAVLERIARTTMADMSRPDQDVRIAIHGDNLQLPSRGATALSVVVNELVQNSLEHAFVGRAAGRIDISLARTPDALMLLVRDDGVGLPDEIERSLGLEIAETLVADDLRGELQFNRLAAGAEVCIRLPRAAERPDALSHE
ncbi:GAF domain-containing protein [Promineifilum sp.]|uniref:GAF domain-containing protein n=1 Tax=Promineifilum sp. TaxID=2664178 RepID=UPI0035B26F69